MDLCEDLLEDSGLRCSNARLLARRDKCRTTAGRKFALLKIAMPARSLALESEISGYFRPVNPLLSGMEVCEVWNRYEEGMRPPHKSFVIKYGGMAYRGGGGICFFSFSAFFLVLAGNPAPQSKM
jgi:hypothetical protein